MRVKSVHLDNTIFGLWQQKVKTPNATSSLLDSTVQAAYCSSRSHTRTESDVLLELLTLSCYSFRCAPDNMSAVTYLAGGPECQILLMSVLRFHFFLGSALRTGYEQLIV